MGRGLEKFTLGARVFKPICAKVVVLEALWAPFFFFFSPCRVSLPLYQTTVTGVGILVFLLAALACTKAKQW